MMTFLVIFCQKAISFSIWLMVRSRNSTSSRSLPILCFRRARRRFRLRFSWLTLIRSSGPPGDLPGLQINGAHYLPVMILEHHGHLMEPATGSAGRDLCIKDGTRTVQELHPNMLVGALHGDPESQWSGHLGVSPGAGRRPAPALRVVQSPHVTSRTITPLPHSLHW